MPGAKGDVLRDAVRAVAWGLGRIELAHRLAARKFDDEVAKEVAKREKEDGVDAITELAVDAEKLEVEEQKHGLVAGKREDIEGGGDHDPEIHVL